MFDLPASVLNVMVSFLVEAYVIYHTVLDEGGSIDGAYLGAVIGRRRGRRLVELNLLASRPILCRKVYRWILCVRVGNEITGNIHRLLLQRIYALGQGFEAGLYCGDSLRQGRCGKVYCYRGAGERSNGELFLAVAPCYVLHITADALQREFIIRLRVCGIEVNGFLGRVEI